MFGFKSPIHSVSSVHAFFKLQGDIERRARGGYFTKPFSSEPCSCHAEWEALQRGDLVRSVFTPLEATSWFHHKNSIFSFSLSLMVFQWGGSATKAKYMNWVHACTCGLVANYYPEVHHLRACDQICLKDSETGSTTSSKSKTATTSNGLDSCRGKNCDQLC